MHEVSENDFIEAAGKFRPAHLVLLNEKKEALRFSFNNGLDSEYCFDQ